MPPRSTAPTPSDPRPKALLARSATPYRAYKDLLWAEVRRRYLDGETAPALCSEYGLSRSTFAARARAGGWRRADHPPDPLPADPNDAARVLMNRAVLAAALGDTAQAEELAKASRTFRVEAEKLAEAAPPARAGYFASAEEETEARIKMAMKFLRIRLQARIENMKLMAADPEAGRAKREAERASDGYFWGEIHRDPLATGGDFEEAERRLADGALQGYMPPPDVTVEWEGGRRPQRAVTD